jgi:hypothetical protein
LFYCGHLAGGTKHHLCYASQGKMKNRDAEWS